MSVKNNFKRLKEEASHNVNSDVTVESDHYRVEVLTRLALRLEEELLAATWRKLIGSMKIEDLSDNASELSGSHADAMSDNIPNQDIDDAWLENGSSEVCRLVFRFLAATRKHQSDSVCRMMKSDYPLIMGRMDHSNFLLPRSHTKLRQL